MKSLGSSLAGAPSAVSFKASNQLDVFAVVPGNKIRNWHWDNLTWQQQDLPAGPAIPAEGICAISSEPNIIDVFVASPDGNNTPWWWRWNGTIWLSCGPLPQGANLFPVPIAAVASGLASIDVFAAGRGNTPNWWHWNGANWTAPVQLPPVANLRPVRIAVVSPRPKRLDVFAAGALNHLWHWWVENSDAPIWHVEDCGGNLPEEGVSAISWDTDRIDVFAAARGSGQGPDGNPLQHWSWDGNQRGGPETLGGNLAAGTVSAVSPAPNRLDVFGISGDGRLARWRWDGSHWSGPNYLGGNMLAGDVSAVVRAPHRTDVFVRGPGNSLLQWPGSRLDNTTNQRWENLAMNWQVPSVANFSPIAPVPPFGPLAGHCYPDSLEELVEIVQEAERLGRHVRAVGSSWSNSDVAVTPDYLIETHKLNGELASILSADSGILQVPRGNLVHVEAGITLGELIVLLDKRGLALPTLGGSSGQTLAGAISTSVHGADFRLGPIPDMVRAIHLVGPGGIQHWIEPSLAITNRSALSRALGIADANIHQDDDWFNSVLVSVGSLGIIYSLIINAVPQYDLVESCEWLPWTAVRARLAQGAPNNPFDVADNRAVNVIVNPFTEADDTRPCFLITRKETVASEPYIPEGPAYPAWFLQRLELAVRAPWELTPKLGGLLSMHEFITGRTRDRYPQRPPGKVKRGLAYTITTDANLPPLRGLALEIAFDATNDAYLSFVDDACAILKTSYQDENLGLAGWFSLRFVGQSRAYLSPQNRFSRTCMVEFAGLQELSHTRKLLARLEAKGRDHGGIQHWGMFDDLRASDVARAYPHLDKWLQVRNQLTDNGTIHTFDNDFTRRCGLSGSQSRGWSSLGGEFTSGPAVASWAAGRLDVFARGTDNALRHRWCDGSNWSDGWEQLGANEISSDPAAVAWGPNRIDVFVRGADNALYTKWWDGNQWSEYVGLGGNLTSGPAVCSWVAGRLDVFARGTDNALWHLVYDGGWGTWEQLGVNPISSDPAAVAWGPNRIDVFVRGTDNALYTKWWDGNQWSEYVGLGGALTSGPAVCSWAAGRLDVFARGTDNALWHLSFDEGWGPWEQLGANPIASDPAAVAWGPNRIDVFVQGTGNALYHKWWDGMWRP
jgi:hypothetical protein